MSDTPARTFKPEDVLAMMRDTDEAFRERSFAPNAPAAADVVPFMPRSMVSQQAPQPEPIPEPEKVSQQSQENPAGQSESFVAGSTEDMPEVWATEPEDVAPMATAPDFTPAPEPMAIDIEAERQVAWDAGHAAAMAGLEQAVADAHEAAFKQARAAAEAELGQARDAFLSGVAALTHAEAELIAGIGGAIHTSVREIASERAGQAIGDLPRPFLDRVEALAAQVATGLAKTEVYMNADDLDAIRPHIGDVAILAEAKLIADAGLQRGDLRLKAGQITLSDVIVGQQEEAVT